MEDDLFREELADILEIDAASIEDTQTFGNTNEWDSLQILSLISIIDEFYGISLSGYDLKDIDSYDELTKIIKNKKNE